MTSKPNHQPLVPHNAKMGQMRYFPGAAGLRADTRGSTNGLVDKIGRGIVLGDYAPNMLFPAEQEMLERFGVSRTALREAYSKLTAKGLVHARPRVGTAVLPRSDWNMLDQDVLDWHLQTMNPVDLAKDLYQVRRMIEPSAAEIAAVTRTDEDMEKIDAAFDAMQANSGDQGSLIDADFSFHVAILTATKNSFIATFSSLIRAAMLSTFELSWRGAEIIKDERLEQHSDVAEAIRNGNAATARRTMQDLLNMSLKDVEAATTGPQSTHPSRR